MVKSSSAVQDIGIITHAVLTSFSPLHTNCFFSSFLWLFLFYFLFVVRVLAQDYEVLHDLCLAQVLLSRELGTLALSNEYRRVVSLETGDLLGLAGLTDSVDSIANSDLGLHGLQVFVQLKVKVWLVEK